MPIAVKGAKTPKGHEYVHMICSGDISGPDAEGVLAKMAPGQELAGRGIMSVIEPGAKYSPEARNVFTRNNGSENGNPVAIVVTNAPVRVMLSFIIRLSSAAKHTRFFSTEADALAFLDEKLG
jgi:hypothetical protein